MESTATRALRRTLHGWIAALILHSAALAGSPADAALEADLRSSLTHRRAELEQVQLALMSRPDNPSLNRRKDALEGVVGKLSNRLGGAAHADAPPAAPGSSTTGSSTNGFLSGVGKLFGTSDSGNPAGPTSVSYGQGSPQAPGGGGGMMDMLNGIIQSQGGWVPFIAGTAGGIAGWMIAGRFTGGMSSKIGQFAGKMAGSFAGQWLATKGAKWFVNNTNGGRSIENWFNNLVGGKSSGPSAGPGYGQSPYVTGQDPVQRYGSNKLYPGEANLFRTNPSGSSATQGSPTPAAVPAPSGSQNFAYGTNYAGNAAAATAQSMPSPPVGNPQSAADAQQNMNFWYTQYQASVSGGDPRMAPQMYQKYLQSKTQLNSFLR